MKTNYKLIILPSHSWFELKLFRMWYFLEHSKLFFLNLHHQFSFVPFSTEIGRKECFVYQPALILVLSTLLRNKTPSFWAHLKIQLCILVRHFQMWCFLLRPGYDDFATKPQCHLQNNKKKKEFIDLDFLYKCLFIEL